MYDEQKDTYDQVDIRLFGFSKSTGSEEATDGSSEGDSDDKLALANAMLEEISDEESFKTAAVKYAAEADKDTYSEDSNTLLRGIQKSTVSSNISEDAAEWLFEEARQAGDKTVVETDDYVFVVYLTAPRYRDETNRVNVRHILISFDGEDKIIDEYEQMILNGEIDEEDVISVPTTEEASVEEVTDEYGQIVEPTTEFELNDDIKAAKYAIAEQLLAVYNHGDEDGNSTEELFATLADKYSDDTGSVSSDDNTSSSTGGLYNSVAKGQVVQPFEDWCYDESRQPGDTGIIESTYGYHVMYFISKNDEPDWKMTIRSSIADSKSESENDSVKEEFENTAVKGALFGWGYKKTSGMVEDYAKQIIANLASSSQ
ncbi:MAG: peptidyl-prolyl cis-trans isomerase [Clostridia bacterium]|nr:peptidyl-prolyl cis-trans isomerase [Clostridia bacterium]